MGEGSLVLFLGRRKNRCYEWIAKISSPVISRFLISPFPGSLKHRRMKYYAQNTKRINVASKFQDLYFQFVQSQLNNWPRSILWESRSRQEFGNGVMSVDDAACLASLPLQFDFRESPGILDGVVSQWQRTQRFFSTPSKCLQGSGSVCGAFAGTIGRNRQIDLDI